MLKKHLVANAMCLICGNGTEDPFHIFCFCPVLREVWELVGLEWISQCQNKEWERWLIWVFNTLSLPQICIFCCSVWTLWNERNKRLHERTFKSAKEMVTFILYYIKEIDKSEECKHTSIIHQSQWQPLRYDVVKINFDANFDVRNYRSESGVVARNQSRRVLASTAIIHEQVASAFAAKAIACIETLRLGLDLGIDRVMFEGDSLSIIKKCNIVEQDKSIIAGYIHDIREGEKSFSWCSFHHTNRVANKLADVISKECLKKKEGFYLAYDVPRVARGTLEDDWLQEPDWSERL